MATRKDSTPDIDSEGVYFLSVEDFEWRPGPEPVEAPDPSRAEQSVSSGVASDANPQPARTRS